MQGGKGDGVDMSAATPVSGVITATDTPRTTHTPATEAATTKTRRQKLIDDLRNLNGDPELIKTIEAGVAYHHRGTCVCACVCVCVCVCVFVHCL